ncbi:MAG TPA: YkgJ family cysteine cluster protein [Campylobacterales bacterium]|nr:YkgJ family cysteine cluster protein [Campylobacterales bacterium]
MQTVKGFKFSFDSTACFKCEGQCCTGESGYIWINIDEMKKVALSLELGFDEFTSTYIKKVGYKYSLVEKQNDDSFECIFFDRELKRCGIYDVRPMQCRTFPFWDSFKQNIDEVVKECPGIVI